MKPQDKQILEVLESAIEVMLAYNRLKSGSRWGNDRLDKVSEFYTNLKHGGK